jgi:trehalose-phosphatase
VARAVADGLAGRPLLLLTDFDGTLSEFVPVPDTAVIVPEVQQTLARLAARDDSILGVVSGRRLSDVMARVGVRVDYVSGLHGMEIAGPLNDFRHPSLDAIVPIIADIARRAKAALAWCPQVLLEDKTCALTCHVRRVCAEDAGRVLGEFVEIAQRHLDTGVLRLLPGAKAFELLPRVEWHKGCGLEWIRQEVEAQTGKEHVVVYLGDDRTDEDAFAALRPGDIAIGVGDRPHDHLLHFRLAGPASVGRLFGALAAAL